MCCFSRPVSSVTGTQIFARPAPGGRQLLAYSMNLVADEDLAMILPLPVPRGAPEGALRFINLEGYAQLFTDLAAGFPAPQSRSRGAKSGPIAAAAPLAVQQVGSFEASFVPTVGDFARLDARFRLPAGTWDRLPAYRGYGFAVFKLKKGAQRIHPMAFELPLANPRRLFFPTVHIHDGAVHERARFDHSLYCQPPVNMRLLQGWRESPQPARAFVQTKQAAGLVDPEAHCYLRELRGELPNEDTWL